MYTALLLVLLGIAGFLFITGAQKKKTLQMSGGIAVALLTLFSFGSWAFGERRCGLKI